MRKLKWIALLLTTGIVLGSCAGENGEPGPAGNAGANGATGATGAAGALGEGLQKAGFFQGTVSGKRLDGTSFNESFKYEYGSTYADVFRNESGSKWLELYRYPQVYYNNSSLEMYSLKLSGTTLEADPNRTGVFFNFQKELNPSDLFWLSARTYFKDVKGYTVRLSEEQNKQYNFSLSDMNIAYIENSYNDGNGAIPIYRFFVYGQAQNYLVDYKKDDGTLIRLADPSNGNSVTSGPAFDLYNKLIFKNNPAVTALTFFDKATGVSLHTSIPDIAADQFTVSNYVHDTASGILTFDFNLKINSYRAYGKGTNTSGHDLTITGSFNSGGKIYKNTQGRTTGG